MDMYLEPMTQIGRVGVWLPTKELSSNAMYVQSQLPL